MGSVVILHEEQELQDGLSTDSKEVAAYQDTSCNALAHIVLLPSFEDLTSTWHQMISTHTGKTTKNWVSHQTWTGYKEGSK